MHEGGGEVGGMGLTEAYDVHTLMPFFAQDHSLQDSSNWRRSGYFLLTKRGLGSPYHCVVYGEAVCDFCGWGWVVCIDV